ncbi:MAG: MFS transporter [Dermatophilaceae bacterium]
MSRPATDLPGSVDSTAPPRLPPSGRAALRGGVIGNYVDQIHIFLPLVALAPALATLAGPHASATTASVVVLAMLLGRPVGGMVFGRIADRWGRTRTTRLAITGTALCSIGIALMPTHALIGPAAIALVLLLRFLGGVFIAGEYSAAIPLAMEWSRPRQRGLVSGLIMAMAPWAQASIAFGTLALLLTLGPESYAVWGWRVLFLAGALGSLGMLGYYRRHVTDAPVFRRDRAAVGSGTSGAPHLRALLIGPWRGVFWQMFGLMTGLWFLTQMTVINLPARLKGGVGLSATQLSIAMGTAAVVQALGMSLTGHLSTRLGRRTFFVLWGLLAAVAGPLAWAWTVGRESVGSATFGASVLQVVTVTAYGPIGAYLSERLPTAIRATGYGTAYSLSIVIPALHPFYLPWVQARLGHSAAVVALLVLGGLLVTGCGALGPRLAPRDIDADIEAVAARA